MRTPAPNLIDDAFHVPLGAHLLSGCVHHCRGLLIRLSNLETSILTDQMEDVSIDRPVYVSGLARSGSTILLEVLAAHPEVATHQYRDFPLLWTPYWWHVLLRKMPQLDATPTERAHSDGMMITPKSPEAMEEVLWMAFFPHAHDPERSSVLDHETSHPDFERFYSEHLRKLLLVLGRRRYASKGNYNVTRLPYLLKTFPDARMVLPVRRPINHIASLMKEHRLFTKGEMRHPRSLIHMQRMGHYEFGLDRRPINVGDHETIRQIQDLWRHGEEVRGWARYWAYLYGWLADRMEQDGALRKATTIVRFEDLCEDPSTHLARLLEHCELEQPDGFVDRLAEQIHGPTYYRPHFTPAEEAIILEETHSVAERFGYHGLEVRPEAPLAR